ncbi:MAG: cytochrome c oxidase assembly protein [Burkholderiales bacterium]
MRLLAFILLFAAPAAGAHDGGKLAWNFEPWLIVLLAFTAGLYAIGLKNVARSRAVRSRGLAFYCGWTALVIALVSPLDEMGDRIFSAHMLQHEILMLIAAPLIVLSKPLGVFAWAMSVSLRFPITRPFQMRAWRAFWRNLTTPLSAWILHAVVLWGWHAPALFEASLRDEALHVAQHASFFLSALLFWWALLKARSSAALYLLTTMIHTGVLGALFTFAPVVLYPVYLGSSPDPLEDQQLGGLIMWVPAGFILLFAGLAFLWRLLPRTTEP